MNPNFQCLYYICLCKKSYPHVPTPICYVRLKIPMNYLLYEALYMYEGFLKMCAELIHVITFSNSAEDEFHSSMSLL